MKTLLFLARVTFIYNLCMVVTLLMGYLEFMPDKGIKSGIMVAGLFLSIVFNVVTNVWMIVLLLGNKTPAFLQPAWLFATNFACFTFQIYMLLK